jgi:DNA modification methylase
MQIVKINEVKPNPKNPRLIKDEKFKKLVKSIQEFPDMLNKRPLIVFTDVDNKYVVLGGNMRLKACKEVGIKEIPVIVADEWTEEQKAEFLIKDNVGFGEWDWDGLANEWDTEKLEDWGLDLPVDLSVVEELEAEEDNYEIPNEINTDIVLGDLFEIGEHRLLCGDSTDSDAVAKLMNGQKADMVFTDPPYGMFLETDYKDNFGDSGFRTAKNYDSVIGDNKDFTPELINTIFACFGYCKEVFIWGADYFAELIPNKNDGSWFVWNKKTTEALQNMFGNQFELCWSKNKHKRIIIDVTWAGAFGHNRKTDGATKVHPTQKPIKLIDIFVNDFSKENDTIADLFLGSGSTMVASHQLKRKCYGMELDPKYCQVIIDRMKKLDPSLEVKRNGETVK